MGVGCEIPLEQQAHGVALDAQGRLDAYPDIAELDTAHHKITCMHTGFKHQQRLQPSLATMDRALWDDKKGG